VISDENRRFSLFVFWTNHLLDIIGTPICYTVSYLCKENNKFLLLLFQLTRTSEPQVLVTRVGVEVEVEVGIAGAIVTTLALPLFL